MSHNASRIINAIAQKGKNSVEDRSPRMATIWSKKPFTIVLDNVDMYIKSPNIGCNYQLLEWEDVTHHVSKQSYIQGSGSFTHTTWTEELPDGSTIIHHNKMSAKDMEFEAGEKWEMTQKTVKSEVKGMKGTGVLDETTYKTEDDIAIKKHEGPPDGNVEFTDKKDTVQEFEGKLQKVEMKGKITIPGSRIGGKFSAQNTQTRFESILKVGDRVLVVQVTNKYWVIICKVENV